MSDGMGREPAYLSSHATNRYFIPNWGILCAEKDRVEVEIALEDMGKPIGVADYQLIVPKEKLQKVLTDEINAFSEEKENDTKKG